VNRARAEAEPREGSDEFRGNISPVGLGHVDDLQRHLPGRPRLVAQAAAGRRHEDRTQNLVPLGELVQRVAKDLRVDRDG